MTSTPHLTSPTVFGRPLYRYIESTTYHIFSLLSHVKTSSNVLALDLLSYHSPPALLFAVMPIPNQTKLATTVPTHSEVVSASLINRAGLSKSPYLQDRARDAVHWQLLDDQAISAARKDNKLIFLHVGYRACHCRSVR
jgi:hypothetical protein